jgi:para-nitrobenzyl esterase
LFDRVVLQSGVPEGKPRSTTGKVTRLIAKQLGIATTRDAFSAVSPDRLLEANAIVAAKSNALTGGVGYGAAIGDALVPRDPLEAIIDGAGDSIPVMLGWTSEEYRLFLVPSGFIDRVGRVLFAAARARFGVGPRALRAYRVAHPGVSRGVLLGEILIDLMLRLPLNRIADARFARGAAPTYAYEFAWRSPVANLGAAHAMEIGFVFDRLASPDWVLLTGANAPQRLADEMHAAWVRFATTGSPGWPAWNASRAVKVFDEPAGGIVDQPRDPQLAAWRRRIGER